MKFQLSSNAANLTAALSAFGCTATVEAEYGAVCVEGSILTLAHHGSRSSNPAPCLAGNNIAENVEVEAVGLSHIDLDSIGGCAAILGVKPEADGFWKLAAFVDVKGPHKLDESGACPEDVRRLYAYWAWSEKNRVFPNRDGSVTDVTDKVMEAIEACRRICADDAGILAEGDEFVAANAERNRTSFVREIGGVIVRNADGFTNDLYRTPSGKLGKAVVALNRKQGSVTVSLADPIPGVNCASIVQSVWTDKDAEGKLLAGGRDVIAGSPRGKQCTESDLEAAVTAMVTALVGG